MRTLAMLAVGLGMGASIYAVEVPRKAPEYVINFTDGKQALLSSFKGKTVALMFIQTTCPHCQATVQAVSKFNNEYKARGFQPIAVAINDMAKMLVNDFVKDFKVNFPVGYDDRGPALKFLQIKPELRWVVPQIVLIDKTGMIRAQSTPTGEKPAGPEGAAFDDQLQNDEHLKAKIEELMGLRKPVVTVGAAKAAAAKTAAK